MKKTDVFKFKPLEITPLIPLSQEPKIFEDNDGPEPTQRQIKNFRDRHRQITPPLVKRQLRQHKSDTMHGAYSVNEQIPKEFHRSTKDIDIWSKSPKQRAIQIENQLDKKAGCDIARVKEEAIGIDPNALVSTEMPPKDKPVHKRYVVETEPKDDLDIDYTTYPTDEPYKRRLYKSIYHETLDSAYGRAKKLLNYPMRSAKASEDVKRIEGYWQSKKKRRKNK